jgi:multidrug efflux pump subunit AcrA (membrane-fusion protein)
MATERDQVERAERDLLAARARLERARARVATAQATKDERTLALTQNSTAKVKDAWRSASDDFALAEAEATAVLAAERNAVVALEEAKRAELEAEDADRAARKQAGISRIVALEEQLGVHLAAVEALRTEQQEVFGSEIVPHQRSWERRLPWPYEERPRGYYETVAHVLEDHAGAKAPSPFGSLGPLIEAQRKRDESLRSTYEPRQAPTRDDLTPIEKRQLLHVVDVLATTAVSELELKVGLSRRQLYTIAGEPERYTGESAIELPEVTPEVLAQIARGLPRALAICAANERPYVEREERIPAADIPPSAEAGF